MSNQSGAYIVAYRNANSDLTSVHQLSIVLHNGCPQIGTRDCFADSTHRRRDTEYELKPLKVIINKEKKLTSSSKEQNFK